MINTNQRYEIYQLFLVHSLTKITCRSVIAQGLRDSSMPALYQIFIDMKTLIIPIDFSDVSDAAVDFGLQLAEKCNYRVVLHHSIDSLQTYESMYLDSSHFKSFTEQVIEDMEIKLENLYRRCRSESIEIKKELTTGSLIHDIRALVEEYEADLVVMGTKGSSGMKEFLVGSNTEKVVRLIGCPVISVPNQQKLSEIRKILVPVEIHDIRSSFLKEVSILQQIFSASVEFCYVKTPHDIVNEELINEEFDRLLNEYEIASSSFNIIRDVFPQDGLLHHAKESNADMLAMATHSRRGIAHFFSGSLTEDVMNHLDVPLWSFKIDQNEEPLVLEVYQDIKELN